jgi:hypothetical protein
MNKLPNELAPCGVYCGACPSFNKTCFGCSSEINEKTRSKSRIGCKIRSCCYEIEKYNFCAECNQFPCTKITQKLLNSHPGDPKFKYRHEIPHVFIKLNEIGINDFLKYQKKRWSCPSCGGIVHFYHYSCSQCGKEVNV